jgi:hypothetical protein
MSTVKADYLVNAAGTGAPTLTNGLVTNNAIGLNGANYGTSGQVLTSGGSGAAPSWTTPGFEQVFLLMGA